MEEHEASDQGWMVEGTVKERLLEVCLEGEVLRPRGRGQREPEAVE